MIITQYRERLIWITNMRILQICKYIRDIYMSIAFAKILMNVDRITYYIPYKQPIILIH